MSWTIVSAAVGECACVSACVSGESNKRNAVKYALLGFLQRTCRVFVNGWTLTKTSWQQSTERKKQRTNVLRWRVRHITHERRGWVSDLSTGAWVEFYNQIYPELSRTFNFSALSEFDLNKVLVLVQQQRLTLSTNPIKGQKQCISASLNIFQLPHPVGGTRSSAQSFLLRTKSLKKQATNIQFH